ncbi:MAG: Glutamyl- or glutaminyl-tRNA synthetase, partial [Candidatus Alkanophagales archaeon MCA70_species_1]|nr:Glutamyl- or glutaminyl-tRNA synthetase [Candidatus Alkanophaga volatiphilum]
MLSPDDIRTIVKKYALQNAVKHKKPPRVDAVVKKLISEHPELKNEIRSLIPV